MKKCKETVVQLGILSYSKHTVDKTVITGTLVGFV